MSVPAAPAPVNDNAVTHWRLWCGRKRYTPWLSSKTDVWRAAARHGLAIETDDGFAPGPLMTIEAGFRPRAKAKTQTVGWLIKPGGVCPPGYG